MNDLKLVPLKDLSEWDAYQTATALAFGEIADQARLDRTRGCFEPERAVQVEDGELIVATAGGRSFELTVPGGSHIPTGGLTAVSVRSTHTGRGLLNKMMEWHFDDCRKRGEYISMLTASESSIYHRYGYGIASHIETHRCADGHAGLLPVADEIARRGEIRLALLKDAMVDVQRIYDQWRAKTVGALSRSDAYWDSVVTDAYTNLEPGQVWQVAMHLDEDGVLDGYVRFLLHPKWGSDRVHKGSVAVQEIIDLVPAARLALWRYITNIPLHRDVVLDHGMPEEPIRLALRDPRRFVTTSSNDFLWLRILDVEQALNARAYRTSQPVTISVDGTTYAMTDGRWSESANPADLACSVADLGAVYLGGVTWRTLANAARVTEIQPRGIERVDAVFQTDSSPFCHTHF